MRFERKELVVILLGQFILGAAFVAFMWSYPAASGYNWWVVIIGSLIVMAFVGLLHRLITTRWNYPIVHGISGALTFMALSAILNFLWHHALITTDTALTSAFLQLAA
jgi:hypothetical protein